MKDCWLLLRESLYFVRNGRHRKVYDSFVARQSFDHSEPYADLVCSGRVFSSSRTTCSPGGKSPIRKQPFASVSVSRPLPVTTRTSAKGCSPLSSVPFPLTSSQTTPLTRPVRTSRKSTTESRFVSSDICCWAPSNSLPGFHSGGVPCL